jgi:hypothetical protein
MAKVIDLMFDKQPVNPELLHEELAVALGAQFVGVSTGPQGLRVHVQDDTLPAKQDQVAALVAAHDASKLTAAQKAEADRQTALDALRKPWAEWTAQDQADFIRVLAEQAGLIPLP